MERLDVIIESAKEMLSTTVDVAKTLPPGFEPNWLERAWLSCFDGHNELLTFTVIVFLIHELAYFGRYLPFMVCDYVPALRKYKIQNNKEVTKEMRWKCLKSLMFSHFVIEGPLMLMFLPMAKLAGIRTIEMPLPGWQEMGIQIAVFFVMEDFWHYWIHRLFHWGPLYRGVHKVHHEFSSPFGMTAEYAHPLETIIFGQGTIGGPILYCNFVGSVHSVTMLVWMCLRLFQAIDAHSGYDFPWSLHNLLPFWAGADHHDYHHAAFVNNFSSSFRWWDTIFGTDTKYHAHKARLATQKQR
ncbi:C-4 sterol methyl oxidase [Coemansia sp. RSA 2399]|nr:C-4 sterol methyl oxidase [Coemansia sp. RSA 2399]KAJ1905559.1 C-4 sterol methyl oxidase [Coemansia sp. IMI 209127]